ncbi:hypothetical protein HELRODRAFT_173630 [Helobdella robusta]|uniref:Uncharacterized protein n=1 Tax=Helobdella robusta TaxID=6412 RepID=T1F725_HELRO|nr:hypothetical protein HELRODRAFT_173630 [Helobdella robusta]ESO03342.1 hypothetical protein HELRODRAFT_173630 [Helobdella robusta]
MKQLIPNRKHTHQLKSLNHTKLLNKILHCTEEDLKNGGSILQCKSELSRPDNKCKSKKSLALVQCHLPIEYTFDEGMCFYCTTVSTVNCTMHSMLLCIKPNRKTFNPKDSSTTLAPKCDFGAISLPFSEEFGYCYDIDLKKCSLVRRGCCQLLKSANVTTTFSLSSSKREQPDLDDDLYGLYYDSTPKDRKSSLLSIPRRVNQSIRPKLSIKCSRIRHRASGSDYDDGEAVRRGSSVLCEVGTVDVWDEHLKLVVTDCWLSAAAAAGGDDDPAEENVPETSGKSLTNRSFFIFRNK